MQPTLADHLLALVLTAGLPIAGAVSFPHLLRKLREGEPGARLRLYRQSLLVQWALAGALAALWILLGRRFELVGLGSAARPGLWVASLAAAAVAAALFALGRASLTRESARERLVGRLGRARALIPRGAAEWRWFAALSLTAGFCEELLYRGFLIAYLGGTLPPVAALLVSSAAFGLAHLYQGPRHVLLTGLVGLFLGALYLHGGTLWVPVAFHAFLDLNSGHFARRALEREEASAAGTASAGGG